MSWHVHHGNSTDVLKTLESESIDSVVCDPPYGLSEHSPEGILEALTCWMEGRPYTHDKKGFMGTTWDSFVPGPEIWRECFRVLKPGGHLLAFAGTRTMDLMGLAIRIAGFESRDAIMVNGMLQWTQCLSEDTEIFVEGRWEHYGKATIGRRVLCYDANTHMFSWQPIEQQYLSEYEGVMYSIQSNDTDQLVTPNHRCLITSNGMCEFRLASSLCDGCSVPTIPSLQDLLQAFSCGQTRQREETILRGDVQAGVDVPCSFGTTPGYNPETGILGDHMCCMWGEKNEVPCLGKESQSYCVFAGVCGCASGKGTGKARTQGPSGVGQFFFVGIQGEDDRGKQSRMEGGCNDFQDTWKLQGGQVREMPSGVSTHGAQRRVCNGTPPYCCQRVVSLPRTCRDSSSCESRPYGQQIRQFDAVQNQRGPQTLRASRFTASSVVRVGTTNYKGIVWCVRVPTGAFVARRNGKIFITGNSQGFPKSHDAAKAIDRELGVDREVVGYQWGVGGENLNDIVKGSDDVRSTEDEGGKGLGAYGVGAKQVRVQIPITKSTSEEAKRWEGWGTGLKPSWEPVLMFRKPFSEKNLAKNLLTHGVGAINVDATRVPTNVPVKIMSFDDGMKAFGGGAGHPYTTTESDKGRWPPNWVVCHHPECVPTGSVKVRGRQYAACTTGFGEGRGGYNGQGRLFAPDCQEYTYECHPNCHVQALNAQSEPTTSGKVKEFKGSYDGDSQTKFLRGFASTDNQHGDSGYISRFFPNFEYGDIDVPFRYTPKVAKPERDAGLSGDEKVSDPYAQHRGRRMETPERFDGKPVKMGRNTHPTVKPQALLSWLIKMVTPPGGTVLDPFTGSGSTGCAAVRGGFNFIGVELQEEYVDIARQRISYWESAEMGPSKARKQIHQPKETPPTTPSVLDLFV